MKKHPPKNATKLARSLRSEMTDTEKKLWCILRQRQLGDYKFRRQVPIGKFIADFVCHEARIVIEVDGGQHDLLSESEMSRTGFLNDQGYRILRFWNNEIIENVEGVYAVIIAQLQQGCSFTPNQSHPTLPQQGGGF